MRVLHVLCDAADGGAERLVLELARRGPPDVRAEIATVHDGGPLSDALGAAFSAGRRRGTPGTRALVRLARFLRGYDVAHTHLWAGDTWGLPAAVLAGVRARVSTAHNVDRDEPRWKRATSAATSRLAHQVYAVSESVAAWARAGGIASERVEVVPNGVDLSRFAAPWAGQRGSVLFVGRLVPQKGVDVLDAATLALPGVRVEVGGEGPLRTSGVVRLGRVDDVPERLARARVAVVPSRWEGFGLFALEAMAAGTPVIASDVDGLRELVGEAGVLVPPGDARALAGAIRRVIEDDALARRMSEAGRERSRSYAIETTVARYVAGYRALTR